MLILRNNVVRVELQAGNATAARELATDNVADSARVLGARHPDTLRAKGTLAQVLEAEGDLTGAATLLEETIAAGGNEAILSVMREHLGTLRAQLPEPG